VKAWKPISIFTMTAVTLAALTGCGATSTKTNQTSGTAANEPTLVMATSADYKPYEFHDTSSGQDKIVGFDIDIANAIAKKLHFKMKIKDMDFNGLIGALQSGRADFVIAGMTPTAKREKSVDFSQIYYQAQNAIVTKQGSGITTLDQLKGKKVGAQLGSIQESMAKKVQGANVVSLNTIPTIVQDLKTNRVDAAIIEATVAKGYVTSNSNLQMNIIKDSGPNGSAIAFPKGSKWVAKFNTVLTQMKSDGELTQLINKWFGGQS
jgi:ABC-type amino acid transport substrate-binding protein